MNPEEIRKLLTEIDNALTALWAIEDKEKDIDNALTALWAIEDKLCPQLRLAEYKEQEDDQIPLL